MLSDSSVLQNPPETAQSQIFSELVSTFAFMKVLIIEDEAELVSAVVQSLEKEQLRVEQAGDFESALSKISLYEYDCILLDIMLPGGTGFDVLEVLRKEGKTENVIIISAKNSLEDKLRGLALGADDYLTKPFHLAELNARIKAVMRRKVFEGKNSVQLSNISLDITDRTLSVNGEDLPLNRKEFDILYYLLLNKNRLVTKSALAEHVWGDHIDEADNFDFIYAQIKNLRKKIAASGAGIELQAVYGVGYKLVET